MPDYERLAFVINGLTGEELTGGKNDAASIYSKLTDIDYGDCDPDKSLIVTDCPDDLSFENAFRDFLQNWNSDNQLIFYFSGHGKKHKGSYCLFFGESPVSFSRILAGLSAFLNIQPEALFPSSSMPAFAKSAQGFSEG